MAELANRSLDAERPDESAWRLIAWVADVTWIDLPTVLGSESPAFTGTRSKGSMRQPA